MLKIRMQRVGRVNSPAFRIVVTEHTAGPKAGKFVEKVGTYNPKTKARVLDEAKVKHWISVGAQPSATVHNMLVSLGVIQGKKINILPAYKPPAEAAAAEQEAEAAKAAEHAAKEAAKAAHDAQVEAEKAQKEAEQKEASEEAKAEGAPEEKASEPKTEEPTPAEKA